jgi:hypothetical protein
MLLVCGTLGVAIWLNMRAGPSYGVGVLPEGATHEARERDYFFVLGFWCWGLLAGIGIATSAMSLSKRIPRALVTPLFLIAALPMVANGSVADRTNEPVATLPRTIARLLLDAVPHNGVLVVAGDNDAFPIWFLQQVEDYRADVQVVVAPLVGAEWYRAELRNKHVLADSLVEHWHGLTAVLSSVRENADARSRSLRVSALLAKGEREVIDPDAGWLLQGLVYARSSAMVPREIALDEASLVRASASVPRSALVPLSDREDRIALQMQQFLSCTTVRSLSDTLLVAHCNAF